MIWLFDSHQEGLLPVAACSENTLYFSSVNLALLSFREQRGQGRVTQSCRNRKEQWFLRNKKLKSNSLSQQGSCYNCGHVHTCRSMFRAVIHSQEESRFYNHTCKMPPLPASCGSEWENRHFHFSCNAHIMLCSHSSSQFLVTSRILRICPKHAPKVTLDLFVYHFLKAMMSFYSDIFVYTGSLTDSPPPFF